MESLPDELNCMIASHLDTATDCGNYRLVSQRFARLGAAELFHYFPFGNGTPSSAISRMQSLTASPHLVKHVKGLDFAEEHEDDDATHRRNKTNCRALATIASVFSDAGAKIEVLQAQRLRFDFFAPQHDLTAFILASQHLKDVHLGFDKLSRAALTPRPLADIEKRIHGFLGKLENLEVLAIWFEEEDFRGWAPGHHLRNIVPLTRTWRRLRSLELHHCWVDGRDLITFLQNHEETGTLACVHLSGLGIREVGGGGDGGEEKKKGEKWRAVFEQIGKMGLRHGDVCEGDSWAKEGVEEWVVRGEGGEVGIRTDLRRYLEGGEDPDLEDGEEEVEEEEVEEEEEE